MMSPINSLCIVSYTLSVADCSAMARPWAFLSAMARPWAFPPATVEPRQFGNLFWVLASVPSTLSGFQQHLVLIAMALMTGWSFCFHPRLLPIVHLHSNGLLFDSRASGRGSVLSAFGLLRFGSRASCLLMACGSRASCLHRIGLSCVSWQSFSWS